MKFLLLYFILIKSWTKAAAISNKFFDHTILRPDATLADLEKVCIEANQFDFGR